MSCFPASLATLWFLTQLEAFLRPSSIYLSSGLIDLYNYSANEGLSPPLRVFFKPRRAGGAEKEALGSSPSASTLPLLVKKHGASSDSLSDFSAEY